MKKSTMFRIVSGALLLALTLFSFTQQPVNAQSVSISVCHATGNGGGVLIPVSISSVNDANGVNGHGTHANDSWASFVFNGVTYPGQGNMSRCGVTIPDPDPVDVCPNLQGDQATIPDGYELDGQNQCVLIENDPEDICPNLDGLQELLPDGYLLNDLGQCVVDEPDDPGDPPVIITTTTTGAGGGTTLLIPVTGVESIDSGQLLLSLSGLGAGLTLLFKGLFGKDK